MCNYVQHHCFFCRPSKWQLVFVLCMSAIGLLQTWSEAALVSMPIYYDSSNDLHRNMYYHPEQPARIDACVQALQEYQQCRSNGGGIDLINVANDNDENSLSLEELDYARSMLVEAHSQEFVERLERKCRNSRQRRINEGKAPLGFVGYVDDDTYLTTESYDVCLRAAACWIRAVQQATSTSEKTSMALTRPPGHHATKTTSNGFCLVNFCAAAALHAISKGLRVAILDWDVHYGQGTADIFKGKDNIRYASIHQTPAFPYMGEKREVAYGNILTIPVLSESTWTCGYKDALENVALPFLFESNPDLLIVSAGYDALDSDELASTSLTASDFGKATRMLLEQQQQDAPALVFGLEGGYQLKDGAAGGNLPDAIVETAKAIIGE